MKKCFLALVVALPMFSNLAIAQNNISNLKRPAQESPLKGAYVGIDYMNISDVKYKSESKSTKYGNYNYEGAEGTHLGLLGLRLGYGQTPENGLGYEGGIRLLETFNSSEYGDSKVYFLIPEANLKLAFNKLLVAFAGLNYSMLTGSSSINSYRGQLGAQAGIGFRLPSQVAINISYTMLNQKVNNFENDFSTSLEMRLSGLSTNVIYQF